jgi:hypothetical protein
MNTINIHEVKSIDIERKTRFTDDRRSYQVVTLTITSNCGDQEIILFSNDDDDILVEKCKF